MAKTKSLYRGRFLQMQARGSWEFVTRPGTSGIVGIVAITPDGELILIEQHRPPLGKPVIELPAGLAGDVAGQETESLVEAAKRELLEETGYQARHMKAVATGTTSPGLTDEVVSLFVATGLKKVSAGHGDGTEQITTHVVPLHKVESWIRRKQKTGALVDLKVYSAIYFAQKLSPKG